MVSICPLDPSGEYNDLSDGMIWCKVCCLLESLHNPPESPHSTPIRDCLTSAEVLDSIPIFSRYVGVVTSSFRPRISEGTVLNSPQLRFQARRMCSLPIVLESCWVD